MMRDGLINAGIVMVLALAGACDKGEAKQEAKGDEAKQEVKGEAKTEVKTEVKTEAKAAAVEVAADGRVEIEVDAAGYHPETITAPAGATITLAFERTTESGCGEELVIEALGLKKELPVGDVVEIRVEVPATGELKFACGMDMYRGKVVAGS